MYNVDLVADCYERTYGQRVCTWVLPQPGEDNTRERINTSVYIDPIWVELVEARNRALGAALLNQSADYANSKRF